jgi:hypothetical protein
MQGKSCSNQRKQDLLYQLLTVSIQELAALQNSRIS